MKLINPLKDLELNKIQSPSRYIGNEYGIIKKEHTGSELYNFAIVLKVNNKKLNKDEMPLELIYL